MIRAKCRVPDAGCRMSSTGNGTETKDPAAPHNLDTDYHFLGETMPTVITGNRPVPPSVGSAGPSVRWLRSTSAESPSPPRSERSGVDPGLIDEVLVRHVLQAGAGQITSRQAGSRRYRHGRPRHHHQQGLPLRHDGDRHGRQGHPTRRGKFVVAGGMESMTNAPTSSPTLGGEPESATPRWSTP